MAPNGFSAVLLVVAAAAALPAPNPEGRLVPTVLLQLPDASPDGAVNPDPESGRGANPMRQAPVVGSQFEVQPISTSMKCVITLAVQYMIVYTALAMTRTYANYFAMSYTNVPVQEILKTAALTVNFAPMLAVLFLACRMRVLYQTQGRGNPPEWMQMCMHMCTYSVLLATLTVCTIPIFTGQVIGVDSKTGDIEDGCKPFQHWVLAGIFTALKFTLLGFLYGGMIAIVYGLVTFQPPAGTWPAGKEPGVSPAVQCTTILCCQFFLAYFLLQCAKTYSQYTSKESKFEEAMHAGTDTMNYAPMLAILFLGARMRSLQMDPVWGHPQEWAQSCFYLCTYALVFQTCLAVAVVLVMKGEAKPSLHHDGKAQGDMEYSVENETVGKILIVCRYAIMICIYVGVSCVIWSVLTIEHRDGPENTPPISVTMQCVINLTCQFFFVYLLISICHTIRELTGCEWKTLTQTMESCKATVQLAPMLAILFVSVRIRALQMTNRRGAPQGWAQDGMYMCCWALLIQFVLCLVTPCFTGSPATVDEDGNIIDRPAHWIPCVAVELVKWICWILLYGGVIAIITAVIVMTPETANGRGSLPLVGDGMVPGTDVKVGDGVQEPVGPNDAVDKMTGTVGIY